VGLAPDSDLNFSPASGLDCNFIWMGYGTDSHLVLGMNLYYLPTALSFPDQHFIQMDLWDVNLEGCVPRTGNCCEEVRAELPPGMGHVWDLMEDISRDIAHEIHRSSKPIEEFVLVRALFDSS